jgi:hypothetical protein
VSLIQRKSKKFIGGMDMEFVSNLCIQTKWLLSAENIEKKGKRGGWVSEEIKIARSISKEIHYEKNLLPHLPSFMGESAPVKLMKMEEECGTIIVVRWLLPNNLGFSTKSKRNRFLDKLEAKIRQLCQLGITEGDISIEESIALMLGNDINQTYNEATRCPDFLATMPSTGGYLFCRLLTKGMDIATVWKEANCVPAPYSFH